MMARRMMWSDLWWWCLRFIPQELQGWKKKIDEVKNQLESRDELVRQSHELRSQMQVRGAADDDADDDDDDDDDDDQKEEEEEKCGGGDDDDDDDDDDHGVDDHTHTEPRATQPDAGTLPTVTGGRHTGKRRRAM
jgi:ABC-type Zn2+ transport system substrate-binding protein/surface adhesin